MTGGRLKRVAPYLGDDEPFCFTYGDGVGDVDIAALIAFHRKHGKLATVTAVQPPGRFGALDRRGRRGRGFVEKPRGDGGWINGGFFVLSPKVLDYIDGDDDGLGARAARAPRARGPACRLRPHRLLAADGHAARQEPSRGACGNPARRPGRCGDVIAARSGAAAASSSPATPASRAAGWRCGCTRWAPR